MVYSVNMYDEQNKPVQPHIDAKINNLMFIRTYVSIAIVALVIVFISFILVNLFLAQTKTRQTNVGGILVIPFVVLLYSALRMSRTPYKVSYDGDTNYLFSYSLRGTKQVDLGTLQAAEMIWAIHQFSNLNGNNYQVLKLTDAKAKYIYIELFSLSEPGKTIITNAIKQALHAAAIDMSVLRLPETDILYQNA